MFIVDTLFAFHLEVILGLIRFSAKMLLGINITGSYKAHPQDKGMVHHEYTFTISPRSNHLSGYGGQCESIFINSLRQDRTVLIPPLLQPYIFFDMYLLQPYNQ